MSRINIAFGTRMGNGMPLDEGAPFSPDIVCQTCLAMLKEHLMFRPNHEGVLHIDRQRPSDCRLCTFLVARFHSSDTPSPLQIEYVTVDRYGYFIRVYDIMFRVAGRNSSNSKVVSLSLQMSKKNKDDGDHPPMVSFQSEISSSTDSEESTAQAVKWFEDCSKNHECCKAAFPKINFVPSRLVEISNPEENCFSVRLRERCNLPADICYATLSHCWGSQMPFKLELDNQESCLISISRSKLSRVFIDAIKVAWRLGIQYLWIDSLCIIQDSVEDWTTESSQMGSVYHHSVLNIAATGFPDGRDGLFVNRSPKLLTPIAVSIEDDPAMPPKEGLNETRRQKLLRKGTYYLVDTLIWNEGVDESPLCARGWVTQERAMSIRTLHFGRQQLFWECMWGNATEVFPDGLLKGTMIRNPKVFLSSGTRERDKRKKKLQSIRDQILEKQRLNDDFRERMRKWKSRDQLLYGLSSDEDESDEEMSDKNFARRMNAIQLDAHPPDEESSESSNPDSYDEYHFKTFRKPKFGEVSMQHLGLLPQDFAGCDLNVLDGLNIEGWKRYKRHLESWGFGAQSDAVESISARGMSLELKQWIMMVEIFSRCSLSFSRDKLVAIAGLAQSLSQEMNCGYLAGLWRRHLEHQLLWKVIRPFPAPQKDGTRGPSWSWASVDGEIAIAEWNGYFDFSKPGDITWMAKVDDASIQLNDTGKFGQVRSGCVILTGCLGVFKIENEVPDDRKTESGTLDHTRRWVAASWDTQELEAKFGKSNQHTNLRRYLTYGIGKGSSRSSDSLDVFYVPLRLMDSDPEDTDMEEPMLTGLLLLPLGKQKGVYQRIGQFELSQQWLRAGDRSIEPLTESTNILDQRLFVSKQKYGKYTICII